MQENTEGMSADSKENKFKVGDKIKCMVVEELKQKRKKELEEELAKLQ